MDNRIYIFDTTLRDGEQVPGCKLNTNQKIDIALELERLGVDVIEAGFPISSPGDFASVEAISKAVSNPIVCGLTRAVDADDADLDAGQEVQVDVFKALLATGIGLGDAFHVIDVLIAGHDGLLTGDLAGCGLCSDCCGQGQRVRGW